MSLMALTACEKSDINAAKRAAAEALRESNEGEAKSKLLASLDEKLKSQVTATASVNGDPTSITFAVNNSSPAVVRNIQIEYDIYSAGQIVASRSPEWAYDISGYQNLTDETAKDAADYHKLKTLVNYSIAIKSVRPTVVRLGGQEFLLTGGTYKTMHDKEAFARKIIKPPEAKP